MLVDRALGMAGAAMGRNDAGFWLACQLRDNGYSGAEGKAALLDYARRVPPVIGKGQREVYSQGEALASVASAYGKPAREGLRPPAASQQPTQGGTGRSGAGAGTPGEASPDLPEIIVGSGQLREVTDRAVEALMGDEAHTPTLFLQAARLVRVGRNEMEGPILTQMGVAEVKEALTHSANYYRLKKAGGADGVYEKVPVSPPREIAEQVLARQTQRPYLPFPPLQTIVEIPVMRPDGTILDQPGYDAATRLYYAPRAGMETCRVHAAPSRGERHAALALLLDAVGEFPYADEADLANGLGLLLTPFLRPAIRRHIPLALLDAPKPGAGKGLLADALAIIATGTSAAILTMSDSDEELQKSITSLLIEGATVIVIDNIAGRLQSKHLEAALTADVWRGRLLGRSKMVSVPQRATWLATGNNIALGGDLARRCYRIRLDPRVSKPWLRSGFTHEDLAGWVIEQRGALIGALLTLARAWYAAGQPLATGLPAMGTFSDWVKTIGSILAYAGVRGFLANRKKPDEELDEESSQWEVFLQAWLDLFGTAWVRIADLLAGMSGSDAQRLALALDATTLKKRFTVLCISVVYRGCAIPVAWKVVGAEEKGSWQPHWTWLLSHLAGVVPGPWTVLVLSDRGLYAPWLYQHIVSLGWHPFMRINKQGHFRPLDEAAFRGLSTAAPTVGSACCGEVECFSESRSRLRCTLLARWDEGYEEVWLIVTDLAPEQATAVWYGMRSWVEGGFKDTKRGGWGWHHTKMADPARAERLWLAIAVATVWAVSVGGEADANLPISSLEALPETHIARSKGTGRSRPRMVSCFARGLLTIVAALMRGDGVILGRFLPEPWPSTPTRPKKMKRARIAAYASQEAA